MRLNFYSSKWSKTTLTIIAVGLGVLSWCVTNALGDKIPSNLQTLIGHKDAILVTDPYGSIIYSKNADKNNETPQPHSVRCKC